MSERCGSDIKRLRILNYFESTLPLKSDQKGNLTKTYMFEKRTRTNKIVQITLTPFRLERFEIDLWIRNWLFTKKTFQTTKY